MDIGQTGSQRVLLAPPEASPLYPIRKDVVESPALKALQGVVRCYCRRLLPVYSLLILGLPFASV
jgi:hypothetical protein